MVCPVSLWLTSYRNRALHDSGRRICKVLRGRVVLVRNNFPDYISGRLVPIGRRITVSVEVKINYLNLNYLRGSSFVEQKVWKGGISLYFFKEEKFVSDPERRQKHDLLFSLKLDRQIV